MYIKRANNQTSDETQGLCKALIKHTHLIHIVKLNNSLVLKHTHAQYITILYLALCIEGDVMSCMNVLMHLYMIISKNDHEIANNREAKEPLKY